MTSCWSRSWCGGGGKVLLVPANPDYPVIDITEREYVHVWGVVTWVMHKL
ncbi:MAG: hypothetical protein OSJ28_08615 [Desulfovibrio sp.]|nr:hypothetical protein [Desulfovibrio sp.]